MKKALIASKSMNCELCGEKDYYLDGGQYQCRNCEHIMLDDFGEENALISVSLNLSGIQIEQVKFDLLIEDGRSKQLQLGGMVR